MTSNRFSRRALLRATGLGAALVPLLDAVQGWGAPVTPRRMVIMTWTDGVISKAWFPTETEGDFALPTCLEPLAPIKNDVIVLGPVGMRNEWDAWNKHKYEAGGHHNWPCLLTGTWPKLVPIGAKQYGIASSVSVDQYVAKILQGKQPTRFPSLVVGAIHRYSKAYERTISYRGAPVGDKPDEALPEINPYVLWDTMFAGIPAMPNRGDPAFFARVRTERKSVLDYVSAQLSRLSAKLGRDDAQKVAAHLETVRALEMDLANLQAADPRACDAMKIAEGVPWNKGDQPHKVLPVMLDLVSLALRCDLTRVVTFMMGTPANDSWYYSFLGDQFAGAGKYLDGDHHGISHAAGNNPDSSEGKKKILIDRFFVSQYASFVEKLKRTPEGSGNLLDNSVVALFNHMANGASHSAHEGVPMLLAGRCQGQFRTGRLLAKHRRDAPHNGVLVALANAMLAGIEPPLTSFGDERYGGELPGLRG